MIIWDDAIQTCRDMSGGDLNNDTFFKRLMNVGYKLCLAEFGSAQEEMTQTASTVASQQGYQFPPNCLFVKSVTMTVGSVIYPILECGDQESWDMMNATTQINDIPMYYFVKPRFGFSGGQVLFYPKPATAGNTITLVYESSDIDLSRNKYLTGTVAITTDTPYVTGTGTTFINPMIGRYFQVTDEVGDANFYKVVNINSSTSLTLENLYEGDTISNVNYQIAEAFQLPEEMMIIPVYYALYNYFTGVRQSEKKAAEFATLFGSAFKSAKERYKNKSRGNIVRSKNWGRYIRSHYPINFPRILSE